MSCAVKTPFGAVAGLALLGAVSGCDMPVSPYEAPKVPQDPSPTGFSATLIQEGNFFHFLPEQGAYLLTVPAEPFGGEKGTKIPCLAVKDGEGSVAYSAVSCDWSKLKSADGPK